MVSELILAKLSPENAAALKLLEETLRLKAYSRSTIRTYVYEFCQLLQILKSRPVDELTAERIRSYILYCIETLRLSENTVHSRYNALRFYFESVLRRDQLFIKIPRPKKPQKLPRVISTGEIRKMLELTPNLKHNTMLRMCYGMGLRVGEVVNLKVSDISSKSMQVFIERGKVKKDRYVNLPASLLEQLRTYFKAYRPSGYLFEGSDGSKYSIRSVQQVFKAAMTKAKVNVDIGIHGLRHSYATHLLEQGTDIGFIKELLGHNDIKTTMKYTHVSPQSLKSVRSPLDDL